MGYCPFSFELLLCFEILCDLTGFVRVGWVNLSRWTEGLQGGTLECVIDTKSSRSFGAAV